MVLVKTVGDTARLQLRKGLQAVVYALKANYPDTFEAKLRAWASGRRAIRQ